MRQGLEHQARAANFGEVLYNRSVFNAMLVVEAIRNAQEISGKKVITGEDMRKGMEKPST
jgi:branched-chain amino acid transport system substrate-binding protein